MSARGGIASVRRGIADIERAVAPHGVHDHRQLARHGDTGLAVAGTFGDRLAPALGLVGAFEARHQPRSRLVKRRRLICDPERRSRCPTANAASQSEVGRDIA